MSVNIRSMELLNEQLYLFAVKRTYLMFGENLCKQASDKGISVNTFFNH